jgi:hypothetical protein
MIIGALLDCGADKNRVMQAMQSVVSEPSIIEVKRAGFRALKVTTHANPAHRTLSEVMECLDNAKADVPAEALTLAKRVFERISCAEEQVHGAHIHFHEVGADDAIADVIGACTALNSLNVDGVAVMPIALGRGVATGSHGTFPIPAPATVEILNRSGLETLLGDEETELCTPTGAALLAEFATISPKNLGTYSIQAVGYGAGSRDPAGIPNVIRALVIETTGNSGTIPHDTVDILETNIDDVSGEVIAYAITRLMEKGARDACAIPVIMKKGRPGFLIRVICTNDKSGELAEQMARELGTLGVRCLPAVHRFIAERTVQYVDVEIAGNRRTIPVKVGWLRGEVYSLKVEYDPAQDWARELDMPLLEVQRAIENVAWKSFTKTGFRSGAQ